MFGRVKIPVPFPRSTRSVAALLPALTFCLSACDQSPPPTVRQNQPLPPTVQVQRDERSVNGGIGNAGASQKQRQAEFLNRLRQADPQFKTIDRAVINGENELGLILDHSVSMDSIPALMRTMLAQMAKEFPGQDLTVIAYAPATPPLRIGTAHLDIRTHEMSYSPEHR